MSDSRLAGLLRLTVIVGAVSSLVGLVLLIVAGEWSVGPFILLVVVASFALVVWVISPTQSRNALTWVLASFVFLVGLYPVGEGLHVVVWPEAVIPPFGEPLPDDLPTGLLTTTGIVNAAGSIGGFLLLTFGLLLFPDGRLPSRRWRWAGYFAATAIIGWLLIALYASLPGNASFLRESAIASIGYPLLILSAPPCLVSLFFRYRSSDATARLQIRWIMWGALVGVVTTVISYSGGAEVFGIVGLTALAASYGIAITKYRLYDIDLIISRTVVLAVLAAFITLIYALVVVGIGSLIGGESEGLILPIAATAIVAVAFEPVRHKAQGWANRLVYGRRASPYEVLADLTQRLSGAEEGDGLLESIADRLVAATGAEQVTVWLGDEGAMTTAASWPAEPASSTPPDLASEQVFPVTHDGMVVGAFEVLNSRGMALSTTERALIADLAGSAGAVLGYQRLNDSLAAKAEELSESRARLVDAQDRERRRLERDLHDGAQQLIVALKVKIALARAMAGRRGADDLESLLGSLGEEAQGALEEVRALAKGIYPPVLESDGLGSAISALASGSAEDVIVNTEGLRRYGRDIEAAIYFDISEAVTNAVKHASGPIRVDLSGSENEIAFSVSDSGPGFDIVSANGGSGLQNLRDRIDAVGGSIEIVSSEAGTTVSGVVPLVVAPV